MLCVSLSLCAEPAGHKQVTSPTPEVQEEEVVKETPTTPTLATPLPEGLVASPSLRFITRRDLYTFLSNAGVSQYY